jgi:ribosomal protein S14
MKKLIEKDKLLRKSFLIIENKHFVLKSIIKNFNFFSLIRWNAATNLNLLTQNTSSCSTVNRCLLTINKKRFNKLTGFSRHVFLKTIRSGYIAGIKKSSW